MRTAWVAPKCEKTTLDASWYCIKAPIIDSLAKKSSTKVDQHHLPTGQKSPAIHRGGFGYGLEISRFCTFRISPTLMASARTQLRASLGKRARRAEQIHVPSYISCSMVSTFANQRTQWRYANVLFMYLSFDTFRCIPNYRLYRLCRLKYRRYKAFNCGCIEFCLRSWDWSCIWTLVKKQKLYQHRPKQFEIQIMNEYLWQV